MSNWDVAMQKLSSLTQLVNSIISNSKKIDELPNQVTLDGASELHVSRGGTSEKISVQQIVNAAINNDQDQLLSVGAITLDDNDLTIVSISGKINNIVQSIPTPTVVNIPYCATGLNRIDLIVYDANNDIVRISGVETGGSIIFAPTKPLETLLVTQISVSDSSIGDPSPTVLGNSSYKGELNQTTPVLVNGSGTIGDYYKVVEAGNYDFGAGDIYFKGGDFIYYDGSSYDVFVYNSQLNDVSFGTFSNNLTTEDNIPNGAVFTYTNASGIQVKTTWANIKAKATEQQYFNIVANTTLSAIHNNSILRIKANATVTIPSGLPSDFNFVVAIYTGVTYTQVAGAGVTQSPTTVSKTGENMLTTFVDGTNSYKTFGV